MTDEDVMACLSIPVEHLEALWNATDAWLDLSPPDKTRRLVKEWEDSQGGQPPPIPTAGNSHGGRGRPTVSSIVIEQRHSGVTELEIRADLQAKGYSQPRISQLVRAMREAQRPDDDDEEDEVEMNDGREDDLPELPSDCEDVAGLVFLSAQEAEERVAARMKPGEEHDSDPIEDFAAMLG